ncbi:hypothetical protein CH252_18730 [Rhodococcus sp. 06-1477-1B]|nr:hypothetical protein CH252_18730 [Rhodococcus sp. 06-1477-1B]
MLLSFADAVDIGGGRGRLAAPAAASLARVDIAMRSSFGRAADINEAWRSPEQANANYARYIAYLRGGAWAPIALPANESIHCRGYAVDTDDTSDAQMRIWNDHGWFWTVYRWVGGVWTLVERWHLEYFADRDNHRNTTASDGATPIEEEDMASEASVQEAIRIGNVNFTLANEAIRIGNEIWTQNNALLAAAKDDATEASVQEAIRIGNVNYTLAREILAKPSAIIDPAKLGQILGLQGTPEQIAAAVDAALAPRFAELAGAPEATVEEIARRLSASAAAANG